MEKVIGIFDEQTMYAERLKRYINERKDIGCLAVIFAGEQELQDFCARKKLSCLILGQENAKNMESLSVPYGVRIWVLSEEKPESEEKEGYSVVFRYQRAGEIIRRILLSELAREERLSELFTVFSPENSILAAKFAEKQVVRLSEKGKTLLLPWDPFGAYGRQEDGRETGPSISELLYLMRKDRQQARQLFTRLPKKNGAEYFCGPDYCTDLWQYSAEEMGQLVACCREYGGYRNVVFVAGAFHAGVVSIMNQSGLIYLVGSGTEEGEWRKKEFYRQMKYAGEQGVLSQLSEVTAETEVQP